MSALARSSAGDKRARTLITPEGLALPITVASRGSRAGALVLDVVILFTAAMASSMIVSASLAKSVMASLVSSMELGRPYPTSRLVWLGRSDLGPWQPGEPLSTAPLVRERWRMFCNNKDNAPYHHPKPMFY